MNRKLHIRRGLSGWSLEQSGLFVGWTPTFRRACQAATEWNVEGFYVVRPIKVR